MLPFLVFLASLAILGSSRTTGKHDRIVYLIRHAEKPSNDSNPNLSAQGICRATCLAAQVFASTEPGIATQFPSPRRLIAQPADRVAQSKRPLETLEPLSRVLDLPILKPCSRNEIDCMVRTLRRGSRSDYPTLVSWQHTRLAKILRALVNATGERYPGKRFDLVWIVNLDRGTYETYYQNCPKL
jgi:hypothetical protein